MPSSSRTPDTAATTTTGGTGGGVYLSNVDDYVSPSQACINPLFSTTTTKQRLPPQPQPQPKEEEQSSSQTTPAQQWNNNNSNNNIHVPLEATNNNNTSASSSSSSTMMSVRGARQRRRRPRTTLVLDATTAGGNDDAAEDARPVSSTNPKKNKNATNHTENENADNADPKSIVQASLADCLACSGCVTTTESVLMEEQHSLQVLRQKLLSSSSLPSSSSSLPSLSTKNQQQEQQQEQQLLVMTLSPAAWADLRRHLQLRRKPEEEHDDDDDDDKEEEESASSRTFQQQFTTLVHDLLQIHYVLDGNLPLSWSLQEAAQEFCRSYRRRRPQQQQQQQQQQPTLPTTMTATSPATSPATHAQEDVPIMPTIVEAWQQQLWPSQALSRNQCQFRPPLAHHNRRTNHLAAETETSSAVRTVSFATTTAAAATTAGKDDPNPTNHDAILSVPTRQRSRQPLPLLSSSCPAVVCMVEKTAHPAVSHLSTTKSPMAMAGAFLRHAQESQQQTLQQSQSLQQTQSSSSTPYSIYHIAVMPCHDKKLEASRPDFVNDSTQQPDVDIVVTTTECLALLHEAQQRRVFLEAENQKGDNKPEEINGNGNDNDNDNTKETKTKQRLNEWIQTSSLAPMAQDIDPASFVQLPSFGTLLSEQPVITTTTSTSTTTRAKSGTGGRTKTATGDNNNDDNSTLRQSSSSSSSFPFVYGSGGYADFIFRQACRDLFGVTVREDEVPWEPVSTTTTTTTSTVRNHSPNHNHLNSNPQQPAGVGVRRSARMATAAQRRKECYQAILYQCCSCCRDGAVGAADETNHSSLYTLNPPSACPHCAECDRDNANDNEEQQGHQQQHHHEPVLRFGLAYGMQSLQRVLKPFSNTTTAATTTTTAAADPSTITTTTRTTEVEDNSIVFDYVEVMACPSGCINGGGQLRISSKETPTETRSRLSQTRALFSPGPNHYRRHHAKSRNHPNDIMATEEHPDNGPKTGDAMNQDDDHPYNQQRVYPQEARHTTYHIVPPLQLSMGAAAGVAVEDIQW